MSAPEQRGYDPRYHGDAPRRHTPRPPYPPVDEFGRPYAQPYGPPTGHRAPGYGPPAPQGFTPGAAQRFAPDAAAGFRPDAHQGYRPDARTGFRQQPPAPFDQPFHAGPPTHRPGPFPDPLYGTPPSLGVPPRQPGPYGGEPRWESASWREPYRDVAPQRDQWGEPRPPRQPWDRPDAYQPSGPSWPADQRSAAPLTQGTRPGYEAWPDVEDRNGRTRHDVAPPSYARQGYAQPTYTEPAYTQPTHTEPAYAEPTYSPPSYAQPAHLEPGYGKPGYEPPHDFEPRREAWSEPVPTYGYAEEQFADDYGSPDVDESPAAPPPPPALVTSGGYMLVKEIMVVVTLALVLALVSKTWVLQAFSIPSRSMQSTLMIGDRVTVSKINPGPFNLQRGDIVVFKDPANWLKSAKAKKQEADAQRSPMTKVMEMVMQNTGLMPPDENDHVIKRLIGLPGDLVECEGPGSPIKVNGQPLTETYLDKGKQPSKVKFSIVVPPGRVWLMGDNRDNSGDSRYNDSKHNSEHGPSEPGQMNQDSFDVKALNDTDPKDFTGFYGSVPIDKVVGRAFSLVWPLNHLRWFSGESDVFAKVPPPRPGAKPNPAFQSAPLNQPAQTPPAGSSSADGGQAPAVTPTPTPSGRKTPSTSRT